MGLRVADHWFELRRLDDDVTFLWEPHVAPLLRCNIWHVRGRDRDLIVDTGMGICSLRDFAKDILDKPVTAVATHAHIDHIGGHHEFEDCIAHALEAEGLRSAAGDYTLADPDFDPEDMATLRIPPIPDYEIAGSMITALPTADYDIQSFRIRPAGKIRAVEEGDLVDLGDRVFTVLHLPGHSPGSIGLWEQGTQTLFSGDAIYDGPLIDNLHHSSLPDYIRTLRRLCAVPAKTIHAGHEPSFGRERLVELVDEQLARWEKRA